MPENPYADGKFRNRGEAVIRAIVMGAAVVVAWNTPYAWYWRVAIFLGIMFLVGIIYPVIQLAWSRRI
jgi:hypothetical protein